MKLWGLILSVSLSSAVLLDSREALASCLGFGDTIATTRHNCAYEFCDDGSNICYYVTKFRIRGDYSEQTIYCAGCSSSETSTCHAQLVTAVDACRADMWCKIDADCSYGAIGAAQTCDNGTCGSDTSSDSNPDDPQDDDSGDYSPNDSGDSGGNNDPREDFLSCSAAGAYPPIAWVILLLGMMGFTRKKRR